MKYTIDRIEGAYAVCENENGNMTNIQMSKLPKGAREGDVVILTDTGYVIDKEATIKIKSSIEKLFKKLWND